MSSKKSIPGTPLTAREHEVAKLVAEGHSNKVIAARLNLSEHTAKFHINNFMIKMKAQSRTDAAVKYVLADRAEREAEQQARAVA